MRYRMIALDWADPGLLSGVGGGGSYNRGVGRGGEGGATESGAKPTQGVEVQSPCTCVPLSLTGFFLFLSTLGLPPLSSVTIVGGGGGGSQYL